MNGMTNWRAVCGESRKHGSEGGRGKSATKQLACCLPYHLTINGVTRSSTGEANDDAERENRAAAAAEQQAFKRACAMFGLGRYLSELPVLWVEYDADQERFTERTKARLYGIINQHYQRFVDSRAALLNEIGVKLNNPPKEYHDRNRFR